MHTHFAYLIKRGCVSGRISSKFINDKSKFEKIRVLFRFHLFSIVKLLLPNSKINSILTPFLPEKSLSLTILSLSTDVRTFFKISSRILIKKMKSSN